MIHYVQLNIDQGMYAGKRIVASATEALMQSPQSALPATSDGPDPDLEPVSYGLGIMVGNYRGHKTVFSDGGIDGFNSAMAWLPSDKIGVVVLSNLFSGNVVARNIEYNLLDRLLGLTPIDRLGRVKEMRRQYENYLKDLTKKQAMGRVLGTSPSHDVSAYTGRYNHPAYGQISIAQQQGRLLLTLDGVTVPLEHFHYDQFRTVPTPRGAFPIGLSGAPLRVSFRSGSDGLISELTVDLEPAVADIAFARRGE
jgi:hypothetical protein